MLNYEDTNFQTKIKQVSVENQYKSFTAEEQQFDIFFYLVYFEPTTGQLYYLSDEYLHGYF